MSDPAPYTPGVPTADYPRAESDALAEGPVAVLRGGSDDRAVLLNRVIIALGLVGLFIAGYLSVTKYLKLVPSCGVSGGCQAVTSHPSAYWFDQPVAYYGLAGYLAITGLAILREVTGRELSKILVGLGLVMSIVGFFASAFLTFTAFTVIGETCKWCLSSAATMTLTLVAHVLLFGRANDADAMVFRSRLAGLPFILGGLALTGVAIAFVPKSDVSGPAVRPAEIKAGAQLVPPGSHILGDPNAPVTIVEFADFCCPKCRTTAMPTRKLVDKYPGKVRLIFRHFPLRGIPGHEMNYPLAIASEYAANTGKFWAFHEAAMSTPEVPASINDVLALSSSVGLDAAEVGRLIADLKGKEFDRVFQDESDAVAMKSTGTPWFFVQVRGQEPQIVVPDRLESELESGAFAAYVR